MDEEIIESLQTDALAFLERAQTAARNTTNADLNYFCSSLRDLIESELIIPNEAPLDLFAEMYDYYARV